MTINTISAFDQLALISPILKALDKIGYEKPSPIQAATIPLLLEGKDIVGQAQTGTGKTAAFALPTLSRLDLKQKDVQVLVLAPTRELAIQVAEAFGQYASHLKGFHVLPIYGGQDYRVQTRALERGVHVVVGTPGRVMDHMRRGNLKLQNLSVLILDEADEMLRMGFIDDVDWILEQTPSERQIALFSATMPAQIKRIATKYLNEPALVAIEVKTSTAETIQQRYWPVTGRNKLEALTRILEAEEFDAMLIFVRTKIATTELSEKLEARGYACAPLNGDIQQKTRERTVENLKKGKLDIIVATDVAARGLDVKRISHVLNYDIPYDTEAYIHRIGRTGRAGRSGDAILFVAPREKRMMQTIERATGKKIELMEIPSSEEINKSRINRFKQRITDTVEGENLKFFEKTIHEYTAENDVPAETVAAALAFLLQGDSPFLFPSNSSRKEHQARDHSAKDSFQKGAGREGARKDTAKRDTRDNTRQRDASHSAAATDNAKHAVKTTRAQGPAPDRKPLGSAADKAPADKVEHGSSTPERKAQTEKLKMDRFRLEVGRDHGVEVSNIVGAIANEAGIDSQYIGSVRIMDSHSFIDLPEGMPKAIFKDLKKAWVCGQKLQITKVGDSNSRDGDSKTTDRNKPRTEPKTRDRKDPKRKSDSSEKSRKTLKTKPGASVKKRKPSSGRTVDKRKAKIKPAATRD